MKIAVSSGVVYAGLNRQTLAGADTNDGATFTYFYRESGGWHQETAQTVIDKIHYDDGDGLSELANNTKYSLHWVYIDHDNHLFVQYGQGDYKLAEAQEALVPDAPPFLDDFAILVGRIIVKKNGTSFTSIDSAFRIMFMPSTAVNHSDLGNLAFADTGHTGFQAQGDVLDDLNTLGVNAADNEVLIGTSAGILAWQSGATARTSLGLGTGNSPTFTGLTLSGILSVEGASVAVGKANTTTGTIVLHDSNSANTITLIVPDISAGSLTFTLPATDGDNTNVLQTDGNGVLSWAAAGGGASTWIALTDTDPANYTGEAGNCVVVNAGEDGLEFGAAPGGGVSGYIGYIKVSDVKAANTQSGTFTQGAWQTRVLNTEDNDTGNDCTLNANQITLAAGTYECHITCPAWGVNRHKARLYNTTGAATILEGTSAYVHAGYPGQAAAFVKGRFTIAAGQALEVQHRCQTTKANQGFGVESNFAVDEVYVIAEFWRVS